VELVDIGPPVFGYAFFPNGWWPPGIRLVFVRASAWKPSVACCHGRGSGDKCNSVGAPV
jgi:hypothetical protein